MTLEGHKLELSYPCEWDYTIFIENEGADEFAKTLFCEKSPKIKPKSISKNGKYKSITLSILVFNDEERIFIFQELSKHQKIKSVL